MQAIKIEEIKFESITHGKLSLIEVLKQIRIFIDEEPNELYSMVIGSDSHEEIGSSISNKKLKLVTAILIHRKGYGGKYFWIKKNVGNIHSLREKIYAETLMSLDIAREFVPHLHDYLDEKYITYDLEIHIDVGKKGDTREMIKEVVGMVTGNGFVAKTKPEAYGASYVADKHT